MEVGYVEKNPNKKRKVLVPSSSESESGLIIKDKKCTLTYNSEKFVRDYLAKNFNGQLPQVKTCPALLPIRHALFGLKEFLLAIYATYNQPFQEKYRVTYYDEATGAILPYRYIKMAIDGCTRQSCGAGAPGGDTKITNVVLSSADFPLSTGRTDHAFLLGSFNSGESEIWQKILLYLWSQEAQAHSPSFDGFVTLPDGTKTGIWLCGDMKELDFVATGGGQACAIPFNRWRLFMYAARISSFIKFEDSNSTAIEHRRVIDGRT